MRLIHLTLTGIRCSVVFVFDPMQGNRMSIFKIVLCLLLIAPHLAWAEVRTLSCSVDVLLSKLEIEINDDSRVITVRGREEHVYNMTTTNPEYVRGVALSEVSGNSLEHHVVVDMQSNRFQIYRQNVYIEGEVTTDLLSGMCGE